MLNEEDYNFEPALAKTYIKFWIYIYMDWKVNDSRLKKLINVNIVK